MGSPSGSARFARSERQQGVTLPFQQLVPCMGAQRPLPAERLAGAASGRGPGPRSGSRGRPASGWRSNSRQHPRGLSAPGAVRMYSEHLDYGQAYELIRSTLDIAVLPDPSLG